MWLAVVSSFRAVVLAVGGVILVWFVPALGPVGPWAAATFSIVAVGIANWWRFKTNRWMQIDLFKRRPPGVPMGVGAVVE